MTSCSSCGKQIPENSKFCPYCGEPSDVGKNDTPSDSATRTETDSVRPPDAVNNGPQSPDRNPTKRRNIIIAVVICIALVLGIGGIAGYRYYTTHSHSHALSRYQESTEQLKQAQKTLREALSETGSKVKGIKEENLDQPALLKQYSAKKNEAAGLTTQKPKTITNPDTATTDKLSQIADGNTQAATSINRTATDLTETAASIVKSKTRADKALEGPEKAVSAAERQKKDNDAELASHKLNLKAITSGDYSSLEGTWTNPAGSWMKISSGKVTPQNPIQDTNPPYQLRECVQGSDGYTLDACVERQMPATQHQLVQDGAVLNHNGMSPNDHYLIMVVEQGAELYNTAYLYPRIAADPTDQSKDRIIPTFNSGQGQSPLCQDANCAYYRNPDSLTVSKEGRDKLKDSIDKAQKAVDKLKQDWAKHSKNQLQCRIDVVKGENKQCFKESDTPSSNGVANVQKIKEGDFSSIAGKWCDGNNRCFNIKKDGSYTPVPDRNHGKLIFPSHDSWIEGGIGKSGVFEIMDVDGPQCTDRGTLTCSGAETIWPTDFIYYPAGVYPAPNEDLKTAFGTDADAEVDKNLDVSKPYMQLMGRHMNDLPTNQTSYHFMGPAE